MDSMTTIDSNKYKKWALPHPLLLHWILNPGVALNEVFLGQRMPKVTLIDKTIDKPLMERTFVPCPSCGELHDGRLWAKGNGFGHWFGLVCPTCDNVIPCLWNLTSLLILLITFPAWILPVRLWKQRWLNFEKNRLLAVKNNTVLDWSDVPWIKIGVLGFGGTMWIATSLLHVVIGARGNAPTWFMVIIGIPICGIGGLLFGLGMRHFLGRRPKVQSP